VPIELPAGWVIALNVTVWPVIQLGLAWAFTRLPLHWFEAGPASRWEAGGRIYAKWLRIKAWKDLLPDGASWFGGGFAKAKLIQRGPDYLARFRRETWRGELCHWTAIACTPLFFLWNPWWANWLMIAYALAANLPCILVQRYNRARFQRLCARRACQASSTPLAPGP
jgi:glycosyl-4,4'-diaponeurosporenoate acyltransferase